MRNLFANLSLLLGSCVAGMALCEVSLRLFYPKYRHLAEAQFLDDTMRIWARTPNSRDWSTHPDTLVPHSFHHNNLALRQHRNFSAVDLAAATNIGFFGDSFTENARLPVQYSFTEPLDYLLNQIGEHFNVLNFGVDNYGSGQSLLHYEHFQSAENLDHVLYVYCRNDFWNLLEAGLFSLDEAGHLVRDEAIRESWWGPLIRRLHTPYLVLDVSGRLSPFLGGNNGPLRRSEAEEGRAQGDKIPRDIKTAFQQGRLVQDDPKNTLEIFRQLIRRWKHLAEHNGSTFSVVLLPRHPPQPLIVDLLNAEDVEVIDLYACFGAADPRHPQRPCRQSPYRFKNDDHWNEAGNRLAAVCLYRLLEEEMGLPHLSQSKLGEAIFRYYEAFEGKIPESPVEGQKDRPLLLETPAEIREKYLALDISNPWKDTKEGILEVVAQPDKRIIASDFDVYLDENRLIYVKEDCRPEDTLAPFFLHVIPRDERDLPQNRRQYGFENRDFIETGTKMGDRRCFILVRLPAYSISQINTGQFVKDAQGNFVNLWEGEFSMEQASGIMERRAGN